MKVVLNLTKASLDVLLSTMESILQNAVEGAPPICRGATFVQAIKHSGPSEASYDAAQMLPLYETLVKHWDESGTDVAKSCDSAGQIRYGLRKWKEVGGKRVCHHHGLRKWVVMTPAQFEKSIRDYEAKKKRTLAVVVRAQRKLKKAEGVFAAATDEERHAQDVHFGRA